MNPMEDASGKIGLDANMSYDVLAIRFDILFLSNPK